MSRIFGTIILIISALWLLDSLGMPTSIGKVANLDLLFNRLALVILSGIGVATGIILIAFGHAKGRVCPMCKELVQRYAIRCRYCHTDLPSNLPNQKS